jgi:hypothetical protein
MIDVVIIVGAPTADRRQQERALSELTQKGIVVRGKKRGSYLLQASVSGYCHHLREIAAARGGEAGASARERLGQGASDSRRDEG